jgi:hypothetical protein
MNITEAVQVLRPNSSYSVTGNTYEGIKWCDPDNNIPTKEEVQTKVAELQAEYDALQYQRDRQYPTWQEQMDMQYHDQLNGTTTWKDAVAKVKADNPKP